MTTPTVFISYSHQDEGWKERLVTHLKVLQIKDIALEVWDDRCIQAGVDWQPEIQQAMEKIKQLSDDYSGVSEIEY